jgi:hypothetical protein
MSANWFPGITQSHEVPAEIDTRVAHPARVYDYILGGKNNFARFCTGLELLPPGIVPMAEWRAESEPGPRPAPAEASAYAAVARKN